MKTRRRDMLRVAAAPLLVLAVLFGIPDQRAVGSAYSAGMANGGGTILFQRQHHWYTIAPNGTNLHLLLSTTAGCDGGGCGAFSPDGSQIRVAAQSLDTTRITVAIVNTNGTGYHRLPLPDQTLNIEPGIWLPQGNRIAVHGWDNTNRKRDGIYALNPSDGSGFHRVTTTPDGRTEYPLVFSPDGSRLLFYHEDTPGSSQLPAFGGLIETSTTGSGRVQLNPPGTQVTDGFGTPGDWSPNGQQLTFTAFSSPASSGQSAVFVEDANGSHRRRITAWGAWSTSAHWSPDGRWILFDTVSMISPAGAHDLYIVHPNGTGLKKIIPAPSGLGKQCCGVWSPTGNKVLVGRSGYLWTANWNGTDLSQITQTHDAEGASWGR